MWKEMDCLPTIKLWRRMMEIMEASYMREMALDIVMDRWDKRLGSLNDTVVEDHEGGKDEDRDGRG